MSKWSDKDMDKLFQDGSEKYDFEYNPEVWEQMDNLLTKQERRRRVLWWIWGGGTVLFLAILFALLFFRENVTKQISTPTSESLQIIDGQKNKAPKNLPPTLIEPEQENQENGLGETIQQEQALPNVLGKGEKQGTNPKQKSPARTAVAGQPLQPKGAKTKALPSRPNAESGTGEQEGTVLALASRAAGDVLIDLKNKDGDGYLSKPDGKAAPLHVSPKNLPLLAIHLFPIKKTPPVLTAHVTDFAKKEKIRPLVSGNSFLIGLTGASEFNSVGFGDFSKRNWKFGLQLEYRFKRRFALRTGVSYIHMRYDAGEGEYEPGGYFWVDGIAPESTRGECNMFEIPLQLSYHFNGHQNNGFFAAAGLASYIITEEHYWYNYDAPPLDAIFYWGTFDDERNWLNIGHISGGYNINFSKKLSLQVGPYMQFPLTGVGHGHVRIYSVGLDAVVNFKVK